MEGAGHRRPTGLENQRICDEQVGVRILHLPPILGELSWGFESLVFRQILNLL